MMMMRCGSAAEVSHTSRNGTERRDEGLDLLVASILSGGLLHVRILP